MDPLRIAAAGGAATDVALILFPRIVVELLFGTGAAGAGLAMSRVCGMALLGLGIACWPEAGGGGGTARARNALLVYGALARSTWLRSVWTASSAARGSGPPSSFTCWSARRRPGPGPIRKPMSAARRYVEAGRRRTRRQHLTSRSGGW